MIFVHRLATTGVSLGNLATAIPPSVAMKYGIRSWAKPTGSETNSSTTRPIANTTNPRLKIRFKWSGESRSSRTIVDVRRHIKTVASNVITSAATCSPLNSRLKRW